MSSVSDLPIFLHCAKNNGSSLFVRLSLECRTSSIKVMDEKQKLYEADELKKFAFFGVAVSTIATMVAIVAVPMLCMHSQTVHSSMQEEINYCRTRNSGLREEFTKLSALRIPVSREKRQASYKCCSCGVGASGPAGVPGQDGEPGRDGQPGQAGTPGPDATDNNAKPNPSDWCFDCPTAPAGPPGPPGPKGPNGERGGPGEAGPAGRPGPRGPPGPGGPQGQPGPDGGNGNPGQPGTVRTLPSPPGQPGQPGEPGSQGEAGPDGRPGHPGRPGPQGPKGEDGSAGEPGKDGEDGAAGSPGKDGPKGTCDHCPPPRTAPGY